MYPTIYSHNYYATAFLMVVQGSAKREVLLSPGVATYSNTVIGRQHVRVSSLGDVLMESNTEASLGADPCADVQLQIDLYLDSANTTVVVKQTSRPTVYLEVCPANQS